MTRKTMITRMDLETIEQGLTTDTAKHKLSYLKWFFFADYQKYYVHNDDRKLFCNIFELLVDSVSEIDKVESTVIHIGYNKQFNDEVDTLNKIQSRFKEGE